MLGFHVGVALGAVSFAGVYLMTGKVTVAASILQITAYHGVNDYVFAVIPLFVVMGLFATNRGRRANCSTRPNRCCAKCGAASASRR